MKKPSQFSQPTIDQLLDSIFSEIEALHPTADDAEDRFDGFVVSSEIREKIKKALVLYEDATQDAEVLEILTDTASHLKNAQRSYFRGSPEQRFQKELDPMIAEGMDQDLVNYANKRIDAVKEYARQQLANTFDPVFAGKLYNEAVDALFHVGEEFDKRLKTRRERAAAEAVERARKAQRAHLESQRESRKGRTVHLHRVLSSI